ncbi:MAG TPA: ferrochelatase, partial [Actinomycetota bacterium]|nr:ferrochelatase [Actinomycetota bacterium]
MGTIENIEEVLPEGPLIGVLLLYPGGPRTYGEIEEFADVNGLESSSDALSELTVKYQLTGGPSTAHDTAWLQKVSLQRELDVKSKGTFKVFLACLNWHPFIGEAVEEMVGLGVSRIIVAPLGSVLEEPDEPGWTHSIQEAIDAAGTTCEVTALGAWAQTDEFLEVVADRLRQMASGTESKVFFTSPHPGPRSRGSLERLQAAAGEIARRSGIDDWDVAWEPGLVGSSGRSLLERLKEHKGQQRVIVVPIGSTGDSLSTLFGIDVECADWMQGQNMQMIRMESLNHD